MIKAGKELLRLQEENKKLGAKVYTLSSQIISLEQDKIDLTNEIKGFKEGNTKAIEEIIEKSFISDIYNDRTDDEIIKLDDVVEIIKRNIGE